MWRLLRRRLSRLILGGLELPTLVEDAKEPYDAPRLKGDIENMRKVNVDVAAIPTPVELVGTTGWRVLINPRPPLLYHPSFATVS